MSPSFLEPQGNPVEKIHAQLMKRNNIVYPGVYMYLRTSHYISGNRLRNTQMFIYLLMNEINLFLNVATIESSSSK